MCFLPRFNDCGIIPARPAVTSGARPDGVVPAVAAGMVEAARV